MAELERALGIVKSMRDKRSGEIAGNRKLALERLVVMLNCPVFRELYVKNRLTNAGIPRYNCVASVMVPKMVYVNQTMTPFTTLGADIFSESDLGKHKTVIHSVKKHSVAEKLGLMVGTGSSKI